MIRRTFDADTLNAIANHPEVRPGCGPGTEPLDFTHFLSDRRNVALISDGGAAMFVWSGPDIYEVHTMFLPEARKGAVQVGRTMLNAMVDHHAARIIWCRVPEGNRACRLFTRLCGFASQGFTTDLHLGPVELFKLENAPCHLS